MRTKTFLVLALLLAFAGLATAATPKANDSEDAIVAVSISSVTWVNIDPDSFQWTGVTPGTETTPSQESHNYFAIEIENIGSQNITKIWANTTYETSRPWGTGAPSRYDAGNFVMLMPNQTDSTLWFVNRVEYNESEVLVYMRDDGGNLPPQGRSYGRFRNGSLEYFWMVQPSANGKCNETLTFRIGTVPHTRTQTGTVDFSGADDTEVAVNVVASPGNGFAAGNITDGAFNGYCVAIRHDCGQAWLYKWNMDAPGASAGNCGNANYLWNAVNLRNGSLAPGAYFASNITLRVPYGVAQGNVSGVLTILASDQ